ncbi:MAG: shikimate kinase, partial [Ferruginibacter sp.]
GKSHWAKMWGNEFNINVFDIDDEIERTENSTINEIFKTSGEDYFRKLERDTLRKSLNLENCIVACGGGTPIYYNSLNWMKENGMVVYLSAKPEFLLNNILRETNSRPLLKGIKEKELLNFIDAKLYERKTFYESANMILNSEDLSLESFKKILDYA